MRIKDFKIENKNDYIVFKLLLRINKENYVYNGMKRKRSIKHMIESCYASRRAHQSERLIVNYSYWPNDIAMNIDNDTMIVYYSYLANNLSKIITQSRDKLWLGNLILSRFNYILANKGNFKLSFDESESVLKAIKNTSKNKNIPGIIKDILINKNGTSNIPL